MIEWKNKYCPTFINGEYWGVAHPNSSRNFWADQEMARTISDGTVIELDIHKNPTYFPEIDQVKDWGTGTITSTKTFKYGTFEFEYLLPIGAYLWPAIWLSSTLSWPPEIDIMEAWSGCGYFCKGKPNYKKFLGFNKIHPGVFYKDGEKNGSKGYGCFGTDNVTYQWWQHLNDINTCKLVWTPDVMEFYYNDHLIKRETDRYILCKQHDPMYLIFDLFLCVEFSDKHYAWYKEHGRPFRILDFKYTPIE